VFFFLKQCAVIALVDLEFGSNGSLRYQMDNDGLACIFQFVLKNKGCNILPFLCQVLHLQRFLSCGN